MPISTYSDTVTSLLAKLNAGQAGDSSNPLTPEESMLLAKAVSDLSNHADFEKALIAVANGHLNESTDLINTASINLDNSTTASVSAIAVALASLNSKSSHLDIAAAIPETLNQTFKNKDGAIGNLDDLLMVVPDGDFLADSSYLSKLPVHNVIYCSDGEVRVHVNPTGIGSGSSGLHNLYHHFYSKVAGADHDIGTFTRHNYCYSSASTVRSDWSHRYGNWVAMTELPLASFHDAEDLQFKILIADYTSTTENATTYRGVGLFYDNAYGLVTGHYHNADVVDSYNNRAIRLTGDFHAQEGVSCVLYNNTKNCVVVIQDGKVWELYSNGWVDPNIVTFGDDTQAQDWVDAQPDILVVPMFTYTGDANTYTPRKYDAQIAKTQSNQDLSYETISGVLSNMANDVNTDSWPYNSESSLPAQYRCSLAHGGESGVSGNGTSGTYRAWQMSQQYLWDIPTKKLIPTFREEVLEVIPHNSTTSGSNTVSYPWTQIKRRVKVTRRDTNVIIGEAQVVSMTRKSGNYLGMRSVDILTYNPYGDSWMELCGLYNNGIHSTELRRLIKQTKHINERLGRA